MIDEYMHDDIRLHLSKACYDPEARTSRYPSAVPLSASLSGGPRLGTRHLRTGQLRTKPQRQATAYLATARNSAGDRNVSGS